MTLQFTYENIDENVIQYLVDNTERWDVIPGVPMFEKDFKTLEDVYVFFNHMQDLSKKNISFNFEILTKMKDNDQDMFIVNITNSNYLV